MKRLFLLCAVALLSGCVVEQVEFEGKKCSKNDKCPPGLQCDPSSNTCMTTPSVSVSAPEGFSAASGGGTMNSAGFKAITVTGEPSAVGKASSASYTDESGFAVRLRGRAAER